MGRSSNKRGSGLLLALTVIVAIGTIVQDYRFNDRLALDQAAAMSFDREMAGLELALVELRGAQAGYLVEGQDPSAWMERATAAASALQTSIQRLRDGTSNVDARSRYEEAETALGELMEIDDRARDHVNLEQRLLASDLVFMDGATPSARLRDALSQARTAESADRIAGIGRVANLRLGMNALALGFVLVVMVYFARGGSDDTEPDVTSVVAPVPNAEKAPSLQASAGGPPVLKAEPAVSLSGAADLCVDLARLMDGRDLPSLLERAAKVLYAKGVVLWVADSDGAMLRPALAHGYSDRVLARLGPLQIDGDNVTSLAYRTLQPQKMKSAEKGGAGAVAVPLISSSGGVGVLAAEMKTATPDDQMMAVARIVAAQLSSLLAPAEADIKTARG